MKPNKGFAFVLLLSLILVQAAVPAFGEAIQGPTGGPPVLNARAAVLMDLDTGRVLYQKEGDQRRPIASLTKLMTALVAIDSLTPKELVTISRRAKAVPGQTSGLRSGWKITMEQALSYLLLDSDNDVAVALAERLSGSEQAFVAAMNIKAGQLGLKNTVFADSYGMASGVEHYSTAIDVGRLSIAALNSKPIAATVARSEVRLKYANDGSLKPVRNKNLLVGRYRGAIGVKTGHTNEAGFCLAAAARRNGQGLVAVLLGAPTRETSFSDGRSLLDYGFANLRNRTLAAKGKIYARGSVSGKIVPMTVARTIKRKVWEPGGPVRRVARFKLESGDSNIEKGKVLGILRLYQGDRLLGRVELVSAKDVTISHGWLEVLLSFLGRFW